jgi:hydroxyacylglutathione hydrolase
VYILYEDGSDDAIVIDVAQGSNAILRRLNELDLKPALIINTHGHTDHTAEDETLRNSTHAKIAIHELDAYRLALDDEASRELGIEKMPIEPDLQLLDGQVIRFGNSSKLRVLLTPGHTEGSICLHDETRKLLFSGDTLFAGGYGRVDGMGSNPKAMIESLRKILELPQATEVFPGHGAFTTIANEMYLKQMIDAGGDSN